MDEQLRAMMTAMSAARPLRRGLLLGVVLGAVNSGAVLLAGWALERHGDYGWYSYSPMPRRYADYLPASQPVTGWSAVALLVGVLVVVNVLATAAYVLVRRVRRS
jgi:heme/copper-type cytochrome/quinol oxidase subunit 1